VRSATGPQAAPGRGPSRSLRRLTYDRRGDSGDTQPYAVEREVEDIEALAHTFVYEAKILGGGSLPTELAASVETSTPVIAGGESFPYMRETALAPASSRVRPTTWFRTP
jgi:hypothetical protein